MLETEFLEKYYKSIEKKGLNKSVNIPKSMIIDDSEDNEGWVKWKFAASKVSKFNLFELEEIYKIKLPLEYKDFIQSKQFLDVQISEYTLFGINEFNTLEKIFNLFPKEIISNGYIPIGQINDEDFIALNANNFEVILLRYQDYSVGKTVSKSFIDFLNLLIKLI